LLEEDNENIDDATVYIRRNEKFLKIESYPGYGSSKLYTELDYLPKEVRDQAEFIDSHEGYSIDALYEVASGDKNISIVFPMIKAYLVVKKYRN
jgi:hypothetical protein